MRFYTKDDERRTSMELDVDEVGASLRYATAKIIKAVRSSTNNPHAVRGSAGEREEVPF
jgi:single-strand DNA-binding protein